MADFEFGSEELTRKIYENHSNDMLAASGVIFKQALDESIPIEDREPFIKMAHEISMRFLTNPEQEIIITRN